MLAFETVNNLGNLHANEPKFKYADYRIKLHVVVDLHARSMRSQQR